jgi:hypothetical protein
MESGGQPIRALVTTTWRSGSTFLGDILVLWPLTFDLWPLTFDLWPYSHIKAKMPNTGHHRCTVIFKFFWGWYLGLLENLGGGPLFLCFIAFLWINFLKSFEGVRDVPPPPPPDPSPSLCASIVALLYGIIQLMGSSLIRFTSHKLHFDTKWNQT